MPTGVCFHVQNATRSAARTQQGTGHALTETRHRHRLRRASAARLQAVDSIDNLSVMRQSLSGMTKIKT